MSHVVEQLRRRALTIDKVTGKLRGRRVFVVKDIATSGGSVEDPELLVKAATYPDAPGPILLDSLDWAPEGDGTGSEITANYSNDRAFGFPEILDPVGDATFRSWSMSWLQSEATIPYGLLVPREIPQGNGQPPLQTEIWTIKELSIIERPQRLVRRLVMTEWDTPQINLVDALIGVLHQFFAPAGPIYLFEGADATQQGQQRWEVHYSWYRDSGTKTFSFDGFDPATVALPPEKQYNNEPYLRRPFHTIQPQIDTLASPPLFADLLHFNDTALGSWVLLPGMGP